MSTTKRGQLDIESVRNNLYQNAKTGDFAYVERGTDAYKKYLVKSEINSLLALAMINETTKYLKQFDNADNKENLDTALNNTLTNNQLMCMSGKLMLTPLSWRIDPNYILDKYHESLKVICDYEISKNNKKIEACTEELKKYENILKNTDTEGDEIFKQVRKSVINEILEQDI